MAWIRIWWHRAILGHHISTFLTTSYIDVYDKTYNKYWRLTNG